MTLCKMAPLFAEFDRINQLIGRDDSRDLQKPLINLENIPTAEILVGENDITIKTQPVMADRESFEIPEL